MYILLYVRTYKGTRDRLSLYDRFVMYVATSSGLAWPGCNQCNLCGGPTGGWIRQVPLYVVVWKW